MNNIINSCTLLTIIGTLCSVFSVIVWLQEKLLKNKPKNQKIAKNIAMASTYLFCSLICPIALLYKSFNSFEGFWFWFTQVLSWIALLGFIGTVLSVSYTIYLTKDLKDLDNL